MSELKLSDIPIGQDHPFEEKLKWAQWLYEKYGQSISSDIYVIRLLEKYKKNIDNTWEIMKETGVVAECTKCALQDGGSCCGRGIEDKFDVVNLFINLLYGVKLPKAPYDPTGCWFLGEKGCLIIARHVICVNFMCKRLYVALSENDIKKVQYAMEQETEAAFLLEEYIKVWLAKNG